MPRTDERDLFGFRKPATFGGKPAVQNNPMGGARIRPNIKAGAPKPPAYQGPQVGDTPIQGGRLPSLFKTPALGLSGHPPGTPVPHQANPMGGARIRPTINASPRPAPVDQFSNTRAYGRTAADQVTGAAARLGSQAAAAAGAFANRPARTARPAEEGKPAQGGAIPGVSAVKQGAQDAYKFLFQTPVTEVNRMAQANAANTARPAEEGKPAQGAPVVSETARKIASDLSTPRAAGETLRRGLDSNIKFLKDNLGAANATAGRAVGDMVRGFLGTQPAQAAEPSQGRVNVVDIGGQKRYFANDEDAMAAAIELDQQQGQAPQALPAEPAPAPARTPPSQPSQAAAQSGSVNVIRGSQQFVRGADGTERIAGVSDPRLAELLASRDSAIRNRPRNVYDPSSVPSPEASVQSADKAFGDALAFIADGDKNATELTKARIAASARTGAGSNNGLKAKDLLTDSQKSADRRLEILEAMGVDPASFAGFLRAAAGAEEDPDRRSRIAAGDLTDQELMNIGAAIKMKRNRNSFSFNPMNWFDSLTSQEAYRMVQSGRSED